MELAEQLKNRTKQFAMAVLKFTPQLSNTEEGRVIARQLIRSASSVGANYRASCRSRSKKEFVAKLGIVVEEIDESLFWFEIVEETERCHEPTIMKLKTEAEELLRVLAASYKTARANLN